MNRETTAWWGFPALETDSLVGSLKRGTKTSVAEMGSFSDTFLRMGELMQQKPAARLSDSQAGGREGCGEQGVVLIPILM